MSNEIKAARRSKINIKWTREMVERLCELYQGYESLYRLDHEQYHNRDLRRQSLAAIASEMGEGISGEYHIIRMLVAYVIY